MTKIGYTCKEAAAEVGVSEGAIKDAVRAGHLPARSSETRIVILHAALAAWADTLPEHQS